MHVGMSVIFQNPGEKIPDSQVYKQDLALARLAEPLGYDSIWSVEHHFTDYTMCPDVLQYLTYFAGRTERIQLGSMVVVLPNWSSMSVPNIGRRSTVDFWHRPCNRSPCL